MKKLLLKVEDLAVDSFETTVPRGRGTVDGNATTVPCGFTLVTCPETSNCPSQRPTCGIQPAPNDADAAGPPDLGTDYTPCFVCCM
jgi:hypothetical protein